MTAPPIRRRMMPGAATMQRMRAGVQMPSSSIGIFSDSPFRLKGTSIAFLSFLLYITCITTVRVPFGTESMVLAILTLYMEKEKLHFPRIVGWAFVLVAWAFVGYATTAFPTVVLTEIGEFTKICLVVLVGVNVINTRARLRMLLAWTTFWYAVYPMRGTLVNYFIGGDTLDGRAIWNGVYVNPNDLAGLCLLQFSICLGLLETEQKKWVRYLNFSGIIFLPLIIILTQSRGAFIALAVTSIMLARQNWAKVKKRIPLIIALCVAVVVIAPDVAFKRLTSVSLQFQDLDETANTTVHIDQGSAAQRWLIWKIAATIFVENPVTGVGIGAYNKTHAIVSARPEFLGMALGGRDTHSTYLNLLAELGVVGVLCFGMIVYITAKTAHQARKLARATRPALANQMLYLEVGLYGYLVAGIWGTYGKLVPTYFYISIVYAAARLLIIEMGPQGPIRRRRVLPTPIAPTPASGVPA